MGTRKIRKRLKKKKRGAAIFGSLFEGHACKKKQCLI
jgi:hypothetical protein